MFTDAFALHLNIGFMVNGEVGNEFALKTAHDGATVAHIGHISLLINLK